MLKNVRYLLYVKPLDAASLKAMKYAAATSAKVFECDVNLLPDKPEWLDGVPTLLDRDKGYLYKGTHCLKTLQALCVTQPVFKHKPRQPSSPPPALALVDQQAPPRHALVRRKSLPSPLETIPEHAALGKPVLFMPSVLLLTISSFAPHKPDPTPDDAVQIEEVFDSE